MNKKVVKRVGNILVALLAISAIAGDVVAVYAQEVGNPVINDYLEDDYIEETTEELICESDEFLGEEDTFIIKDTDADGKNSNLTSESEKSVIEFRGTINKESGIVDFRVAEGVSENNTKKEESYCGKDITIDEEEEISSTEELIADGLISMSNSDYENKFNKFISDYRWKNGASYYNVGWIGSNGVFYTNFDGPFPYIANHKSTGCWAYGDDFAKYMYGIDSYSDGGDYYNNPNEIRDGDIIRTSGGHTFVVLRRNGNNLYTAEGAFMDNYQGSGVVRVTDAAYTVYNCGFGYGYHFVNLNSNPCGRILGANEGAGRTIPDGDYQIISALGSDLTLDIQGDAIPAANDSKIDVWHGLDRTADIFHVEYLGGSKGYYKITQKGTNQGLVIAGPDLHRSTEDIIYAYSSDNLAFQWSIEWAGDGYCILKNRYGGYCLDVVSGDETKPVENGRGVIQWEQNNSDSQRWGFVQVKSIMGANEGAGKTITDGDYVLVSALDSNLSLDVQGDTIPAANGAKIQVWHGINRSADIFHVEYLGGTKGYYKITQKGTSQGLVIKGPGLQMGATDCIWGYFKENLGFQWSIIDVGGGNYVLKNRYGGYCLDICSGDEQKPVKDGREVIQWERNDSNSQKWQLISVKAPTITTGSLPEGTTGKSYSVSVSVSSDTSVSWSCSGSLPPGLTFSNGKISGTPTTAGTYSITVTAKNTFASSSKTYSIKIVSATVSVTGVSLNKSSTNITVGKTETLTATVSPSNATNKNVTWSSSNTNVATVNSSGVVTAKSEGTANITVKTNDGGKTATCKVTVVTVPMITTASLPNGEVGKNYSATLTASGTTPITWIKTAGSLPDGLTLNSNGVVSGKPTKSGSFVVTVQAKNNYGNSPAKQLTITIGGVAPKITTEYKYGVGSIAIRAAEEGKSYSFTFTADGTSPLRWSIVGGTSLPDGLALITSTGQIYGTPTTVGGKTFKVRVENDYGYDEKDFFINVYTNVPRIVTESLPDGVAGEKYVADLDNTNYDVDGDISKLYVSAGTQLNEWLNDAELIHNAWHSRITGIPKKAGVFTFTLTVENSYGKSSKQFTVNVKPSKAEPKPVNDETDSTIVAGQKIDLKEVCFANVNASISRYVVDNKSIASVSKTMLSGIKAGTVTVTAQTKVDKNTYEDVAACKVTVLNKPKLKFSRTMTYDGQTMRASDYFTTDDTDIIGATYWESSKPAVVEVIDAKTGTIRAHKNGSASISAYFGEKGKAGTLKVTATVNVKVPAFQKNEYKMQTGADLVLSMKNVVKTQNPVWVTDNGSVATAAPQLDKNGNHTGKVVVEGLNYGDTTLTATIDGQKYRCVIHVTAPRISKTSLTVKKGKTATLSLQNTKYKKSQINWKSSNESIVTVDANGKVKGISAGEAVIYTTTGGIRNECVVTVK